MDRNFLTFPKLGRIGSERSQKQTLTNTSTPTHKQTNKQKRLIPVSWTAAAAGIDNCPGERGGVAVAQCAPGERRWPPLREAAAVTKAAPAAVGSIVQFGPVDTTRPSGPSVSSSSRQDHAHHAHTCKITPAPPWAAGNDNDYNNNNIIMIVNMIS